MGFFHDGLVQCILLRSGVNLLMCTSPTAAIQHKCAWENAFGFLYCHQTCFRDEVPQECSLSLSIIVGLIIDHYYINNKTSK